MPKITLHKLSSIAATAAAGLSVTETELNASAVVADLTLDNKSVQKVGGIVADKSGNIYVADEEQHIILKITEDGDINTFAGVAGSPGNNAALQSVAPATARFNAPKGLAMDNSGNLYVADSGNNQIRIVRPNGYVGVYAGNGAQTAGLVDASANPLQARFSNPVDVAVDNSGKLYICDQGNHAVRKIDGGYVETIAGNGSSGDSANSRASSLLPFCDTPTAIAVDALGNIYLNDDGNKTIKKIVPRGWIYRYSGGGNTGTSLGTEDTLNGISKAFTCSYTSLQFSSVDARGNLFVVDQVTGGKSRLVKVDRDGIPSNVVDFNAATTSRDGVLGVAVTPAQKLFITITTPAEAESSSSSSADSSSSSSGA
tara:strand:+ start:6413 stop:7522 length:1110 start_codon:yes stop_codon:yes gene_type:complete